MSRAIANPPPGFDDLPVEEQIEYVQSLWDRIAAKEADVPVPDWHRAELERRLEDRPEQAGRRAFVGRGGD